MEHAEFMGVYRTKEDAQRGVFPSLAGGVLWQAWQMPDGNVMLQGIDADEKPVGEVFLVDQAVFLANACIAVAGGLRLDADAPDLLFHWYEQALAETAPGQTPPLDTVRTPARKQQDRLWEELLAAPSALSPEADHAGSPGIPGFGDEPPPTLAKDDADFRLKPASAVAMDSGPSAVAQAPAITQAYDREDSDNCPLPEEQDSPVAGTFDEARADIVEAAMRTEFHILLKKLRRSDPLDVVAELERLIMRKEVLTWRQKYMFTEFGLALRREQQYEAALTCHLRALDLAPRDPHVLFNVARTEYELGRAASARDHLEQALEAAPQFVAARHFLDFLYSGGAVREFHNEL